MILTVNTTNRGGKNRLYQSEIIKGQVTFKFLFDTNLLSYVYIV